QAAQGAIEEQGPRGERDQGRDVARPHGPDTVGGLLELGELERVEGAGVARGGRQLDALDDQLDRLEVARAVVVFFVIGLGEEVDVEGDRVVVGGGEVERRGARVGRYIDEACTRGAARGGAVATQ